MHYIQAIIGENKFIQKLSHVLNNAENIELNQGKSLIFLPAELKYNPKTSGAEGKAFQEFSFLSKEVVELLEQNSTDGKIAYIETEYFGGTGTQSAILFENGKIKMGPLVTDSKQKEEKFVQNPQGEKAINKILKLLDVSKENFPDEFQALGLMNLRSNKK